MKGGPVPKRVFIEVEGDSERNTFYTVPTALLLLKATKGMFYHILYIHPFCHNKLSLVDNFCFY